MTQKADRIFTSFTLPRRPRLLTLYRLFTKSIHDDERRMDHRYLSWQDVAKRRTLLDFSSSLTSRFSSEDDEDVLKRLLLLLLVLVVSVVVLEIVFVFITGDDVGEDFFDEDKEDKDGDDDADGDSSAVAAKRMMMMIRLLLLLVVVCYCFDD